MSLAQVSLYLERFSHIEPPEKTIKEAVVLAFDTFFKTNIPYEAIRIQRKKITVSLHPVLKSEVAIHKKKLLVFIQNTLQKNSVTDLH
ncbi:MAG: hypothetical protein COU33_04845 [Candidatus Magasanikbacteria bacterium CG10_big_fil_rev_8_21_14_0_10_43_6]|uniref:Uncharacterized protein n=1 Tax=Candidatus Magasanikbacteria bacterium CG10_big_fil_rev_8_21_14_0_10_43_6 TaxID=1974650 RepID=A0A2M6W004_9BACT|nr:MAG: hypothetical protein COU33_04845 [Candidatus Magasanikbacteria bacterium CG10_big_fil_rev_8_21_14_0_10_43_6]